jgi:hypothetical protein
MSITTSAAPGGWQDSYGLRVAKKLAIGTSTVLAALVIYGSFQGRQASHYAELDIAPKSKSGAQIARWAWPLSQTGFILADQSSYLFLDSVSDASSRIIIGVGGATSTGQTITTKVAEITPKADQYFTLSGCGAVKLPNRISVSPGQYVTLSWYNGSGSKTINTALGFARIKVEPCGTDTFVCD